MTTQPPERDDLRRIAAAFPYPPTPPIAAAVTERLHASRRPTRRPVLRLAAAALLALLALLAVPEARAALWSVLRIGAIRIVPTAASPAPELPSSPAPAGSVAPATPRPPTPTPVLSVLDLAGETTLAEAQEHVGFPIRLPAYPADLGPPDRVFVQDFAGPVLILVWLDPADAAKVRLSLHQFGPDTFAEKLQPRVVRETEVHGQRALWASGPHLLQTRRGDEYVQRRLVNGHVLIWTAGEMTYRLENRLSETEAIRVAESLR